MLHCGPVVNASFANVGLDHRTVRSVSTITPYVAPRLCVHGPSSETLTPCGLCRRIALKRRPVNTPLKLVVWRKQRFERKCKTRGAMRLEIRKALLGFIDAR